MKYSCSLTVRTYENDAYGHVNNAVYLHYLEFARGEYLRQIGMDYQAIVAAGYGIWIARVEIDYKYPAKAGDELTIETEALERKSTWGLLGQRVMVGDKVSAEARVKWVFVDTATGRPMRLPAEFENAALTPEATT